MKRGCMMGLLAIMAAAAAVGQVHSGDIVLSIDAWGRLRTGGADSLGNSYPTQRVFAATFGSAPNFTNNPGFDAEFGTFVPGTPVGFNIRAALRVWDVADANFEAIPAERVQARLGPLGPVVTPPADQLVPGFTINAGGDGKYHHHIGYTLLSPSGAGVYLLEMEMMTTGGVAGVSRPFYLVFNQNVSAAELERAALWVRTHYTCPADVNDDRAVDLSDYFDFFNAFDQSLGAADVNADNVVDLNDFFEFLNSFDAGC